MLLSPISSSCSLGVEAEAEEEEAPRHGKKPQNEAEEPELESGKKNETLERLRRRLRVFTDKFEAESPFAWA